MLGLLIVFGLIMAMAAADKSSAIAADNRKKETAREVARQLHKPKYSNAYSDDYLDY